MDFDHENCFITFFPEIVKVNSIVPFNTDAPPNVAFAANKRDSLPAIVAVAAVFVFTVTPSGNVPTVHVQGVCSIPTYPVKGMFTRTSAATAPFAV